MLRVLGWGLILTIGFLFSWLAAVMATVAVLAFATSALNAADRGQI